MQPATLANKIFMVLIMVLFKQLRSDQSRLLQILVISRADDWQKVLSLRTLLVRSVQHLVTYTKMFVCMSSFRIQLMTSSLMSTN